MKFIVLATSLSLISAQSFIETLTANNLTSALAALQKANLTDQIADLGQSTFFVPTNAAFEQIKDVPLTLEQLQEILLTHATSGVLRSTDAINITVPTFNQKQNLTFVVSDDKITVNGIPVVQAGIATSQGVAHVIDRVIIPSYLNLATTTTTKKVPAASSTADAVPNSAVSKMAVSFSAISILLSFFI